MLRHYLNLSDTVLIYHLMFPQITQVNQRATLGREELSLTLQEQFQWARAVQRAWQTDSGKFRDAKVYYHLLLFGIMGNLR